LKLVHGKLPTNSELAKSSPHQTSTCHYCPERETFQHLIQCSNETSSRFRSQMIASIDLYMNARGASESFRQCFLQSLETALGQTSPHEFRERSLAATQCYQAQLALGHSSILRGFLSSRWGRLYEITSSVYTCEIPTNTVDFLAGIVKQIWTEQMSLWETHLHNINQTSPSTPTIYQDKFLHYKTKIRALHNQRDHCLHAHRDQYFFSDVDRFLHEASGNQMKQYLLHYEPAILSSIAAAKRQQTRTILSFPGFVRHRVTQVLPRYMRFQTTTTNTAATPGVIRGTPSNRKHTRWRPLSSTQFPSIRNFFHPKPD
jgi:hypothetical protein